MSAIAKMTQSKSLSLRGAIIKSQFPFLSISCPLSSINKTRTNVHPKHRESHPPHQPSVFWLMYNASRTTTTIGGPITEEMFFCSFLFVTGKGIKARVKK